LKAIQKGKRFCVFESPISEEKQIGTLLGNLLWGRKTLAISTTSLLAELRSARHYGNTTYLNVVFLLAK